MFRKPFILWALVGGYAATIWVLSSMPNLDPPDFIKFRFWDKTAHAAEYGILGFLVLRAMGTTWNFSWKLLVLSGLLASLYGVIDEIHQYHVPGRFFQISDMAADAIGSWMGVVACTLTRRK